MQLKLRRYLEVEGGNINRKLYYICMYIGTNITGALPQIGNHTTALCSIEYVIGQQAHGAASSLIGIIQISHI